MTQHDTRVGLPNPEDESSTAKTRSLFCLNTLNYLFIEPRQFTDVTFTCSDVRTLPPDNLHYVCLSMFLRLRVSVTHVRLYVTFFFAMLIPIYSARS